MRHRTLIMAMTLMLAGGCGRKSEPPSPGTPGAEAPAEGGAVKPVENVGASPAKGPAAAVSPDRADAPCEPLPLLELSVDLDVDELFEGDPLAVNLRLRNLRLLEALSKDGEPPGSTAAEDSIGLANLPADWIRDATVTLERLGKGSRSGVCMTVPAADFVVGGNVLAFGASVSEKMTVPSDKALLTVGSYMLTVSCPSSRLAPQAKELAPVLVSHLAFEVVAAKSLVQRATHAGRLARQAHRQEKFDKAAAFSRQALEVIDTFDSACVEQYLILADSLIGLGKFDDALTVYDELAVAAGKNDGVLEMAKERKQMLERLMQ